MEPLEPISMRVLFCMASCICFRCSSWMVVASVVGVVLAGIVRQWLQWYFLNSFCHASSLEPVEHGESQDDCDSTGDTGPTCGGLCIEPFSVRLCLCTLTISSKDDASGEPPDIKPVGCACKWVVNEIFFRCPRPFVAGPALSMVTPSESPVPATAQCAPWSSSGQHREKALTRDKPLDFFHGSLDNHGSQGEHSSNMHRTGK